MNCDCCKTAPLCDFYFCIDCQKKENHVGSFRCINCDKTTCSTYYNNSREYPEYCWKCFIDTEKKIINTKVFAESLNVTE